MPQDSAPVAKAPTPAAEAVARNVTSTDATVNVSATQRVSQVPTMTAAPQEPAAPREAMVDVAAGVLGLTGTNPSTTHDPAPAEPALPAALMATQFTRRETQQAALAGTPALAQTTTSQTVSPQAASASATPAAAATPTARTTAAAQATPAATSAAVDSTAALQAKFNALKPGDTLKLDPGTYNYSDNLYIRTSNVSVIGNGTTLNSTNSDKAAVVIQANNVTFSNVNLTAPTGQTRKDGTDQSRLVFGADGVKISDVTITGGASAGIYITGGSHFQMDRVTVQDTAADGVQITNGSNNAVLNNVTTRRTGDDGIAVVSYQTLPTVHDITINNPVVSGGGQRGLVVVGGQGITFNNINVSDTALQAVFVGSQGAPFYTQSTRGVEVNGGIVTRGGKGGLPYGAVAVVSQSSGQTVANVTIENLSIVDTPPSAYGNVGILVQDGTLSAIAYRNIAITQSTSPYPLPLVASGAAPGTYTASGFTVNGAPVTV